MYRIRRNKRTVRSKSYKKKFLKKFLKNLKLQILKFNPLTKIKT